MAKLAVFAIVFTAFIALSGVGSRKTITTSTVLDNDFKSVWEGLENYIDPAIGKRFGDGVDNAVVIDGRIWDGLDNGKRFGEQCRSQIPIEQLNHCKMHLTQEQHLQQCCNQLKQVSEQCQCAAIQQAFSKAWQQEGGLQKVSQIASKAYKLPNDCGLKVKDCPLKVPRV
uniref:PawS-like protein 1b n=1 Tax=Cosmos bipinnatus TaxID=51277 RepID=A0A1V0JB73_COSBI|nr:PawS-like protein 1b [Cosmos bipinnatus]